MRMKNLSNFFIGMLAMCTLAACSDNELGNDPDVNTGTSKDAVYLSVKVQLPTGAGTRSETQPGGGSDSGTEVGNDNENKVNSILLVLAKKTDNSFIGCAEKQEELTQTKNSTSVTAIQSVSKSVLSAYYGSDGVLDATKDENKINIFVFCNPTNALREMLAGVSAGNKLWYDQICTISEQSDGTSDNAAIWGGKTHTGGFLMSSYSISEKKLPVKFSDWDQFTTKEKPFKFSEINNGVSGGGMSTDINNTGSIEVERSVARFDFKDGSPYADATDVNKRNTYDVIYNEETDKKCLVQIQLQRMALVNMSKNFYYLRRVSDDGTKDGNNYALGGVEIGGDNANYVVDTDADAKKNGTIIKDKLYGNHFNFCFGHTTEDGWTIDDEARGQWYSSKIATVLNGTEDNDDPKGDNGGWYEENKSHDGYRIWRYVTENTIPDPTSKQQNGITTGIVFKGKMIATDNLDKESSLYKALTSTDNISPDNPILYAYGSSIYVRWTEVRAMAIESGESSTMYKAVFGTPKEVTPKAEKKTGETVTEKAVYSDDEDSADYKWDLWYNQNKDNKDKLKEFKAAATGANFTLYERSDDGDTDGYGKGYYCYYYYWNRHNNNDNPGVMGKMEFAVVRNNVYKLAVTKISKLGHPRISENDPDPKDPEDPDEDGDLYLSVSVEVLPWVVRINDIEF